MSMLSYFEVPENLDSVSPHVNELWKRYLAADDKFRIYIANGGGLNVRDLGL